MPLKGAKKKSYNKKYYAENKRKIADKRADYREDVEKSHTDSAAHCRDSYMKDPEKSVAHSTA